MHRCLLQFELDTAFEEYRSVLHYRLSRKWCLWKHPGISRSPWLTDIKSPSSPMCKRLGLHSMAQRGGCEMFNRWDLFKEYWIMWREPLKVIIKSMSSPYPVSQNRPCFFLNWLSQAFCDSDKKLVNTIGFFGLENTTSSPHKTAVIECMRDLYQREGSTKLPSTIDREGLVVINYLLFDVTQLDHFIERRSWPGASVL